MKRQYNEGFLELDSGIFVILVFSIYGSMGRECITFYKRLAKKIVEKREVHKSFVTNWIQTKVSFALLTLALPCLRGSRSLSRNMYFVGDNIEVAHKVSKI